MKSSGVLLESCALPQKLSRREWLIRSAAFAGGITLVACSPFPTDTTNATTTGKKPLTLVFLAGIQGAAFYRMIEQGVERIAHAQGVRVLFDAPATWDPNLQTQLVDAFIAKRVDAILIAPTDHQMLIAPLQRAHDQGILVVTVDTFLGTGDDTKGAVTFPLVSIGSDNVAGGRLAGEALIKTIGGAGNVYLQNNTSDASTAIERARGFKQAIAATNGAVTLVAEEFDEGDVSKATAQTAAILAAHPDLVGIFGADINSAQGAVAAVKNAKKAGFIKIAQFDAPPQAIQDVRNGLVDLVIAQKPFDMGRIAADAAIKALRGTTSDLPRHVATGFVVIDKNTVDTPEAQSAIYQ